MGSYLAAGVERFSASSISQRALVSFASILLRCSWRSIVFSLPIWGKEALNCCTKVAGPPIAFCAHSHKVGRILAEGCVSNPRRTHAFVGIAAR